MPKLSANLTFLFTEVPFLERFEAAAKAGFKAVEFAFAYEFPLADVVERVRAAGVQVVLINAPPGDWQAGERGTGSLPAREHEFAAGVSRALRFAKALECPRIHVMAGCVPLDEDAEAYAKQRALQRAIFVRNLRFACEEAQGYGVTLLLEALNPFDVPNYLYSTQAEAHALRDEVNAPNLKVQMDLYHTQMVEGGLSEKLHRYIAKVGHIQIAGVPGRHEPDLGEINYGYLLRVIDELGYEGYVGCEYVPRNSTLAGLSWRDRLLNSRATLHAIHT
jgi:2-dehydrotetronate isomerase